jgi:hypothetical protein
MTMIRIQAARAILIGCAGRGTIKAAAERLGRES